MSKRKYDEIIVNADGDVKCFTLPFSESESDESEPEQEDPFVDTSATSNLNGWWEIDLSRETAAPAPFEFREEPRLNLPLDPETSGPLKYFDLFIDDALIGTLVDETNAFSRELHVKEGSYAKNKGWEDLTDKEIKVFIGLLLLQDVISLPRQEWYWSKRESIHIPVFSKIMTRDRFRSIMKYWHLSESPKMGHVVDHVRRACSQILTPKKSLSVDESMNVFKNRLGWKQYVPMKRSYDGARSYALFESESGYIWNFLFYVGKNTVFQEEYKSFSRSSKIVLELMTDLLDKGYCLTLDAAFSSPSLADYLVRRSTDICGTIRPDRKDLPTDLERRKLSKGEMMAFQRGKLMVLKWQGKRPITALSTVHDVSMQTMRFKRGKDSLKPSLLFDCNTVIGSVDRTSAALGGSEAEEEAASSKHRKKYYKAVFRHLLDIAVYNAFAVFRTHSQNTKKTFLDFKMEIIEGLLAENRVSKKVVAGGPRTPNIARLTERHFISHVPPNNIKKEPCRRCVLCCSKRDAQGNKIRKETRFWCEECKVGLCVDPCFKLYHTKPILSPP